MAAKQICKTLNSTCLIEAAHREVPNLADFKVAKLVNPFNGGELVTLTR